MTQEEALKLKPGDKFWWGPKHKNPSKYTVTSVYEIDNVVRINDTTNEGYIIHYQITATKFEYLVLKKLGVLP